MSRPKAPLLNKICPLCEKEFEYRQNYPKVFCGNRCRLFWQKYNNGALMLNSEISTIPKGLKEKFMSLAVTSKVV